MITAFLRLLWGAPKPRGPAHIYAEPGSIHEKYIGLDRCLGCPRVDEERTQYTDPPCPRRLEELP